MSIRFLHAYGISNWNRMVNITVVEEKKTSRLLLTSPRITATHRFYTLYVMPAWSYNICAIYAIMTTAVKLRKAMLSMTVESHFGFFLKKIPCLKS